MEDGILQQILAACRMAEIVGTAARHDADFDIDYLHTSCIQVAAAFNEAATALRSGMPVSGVFSPSDIESLVFSPIDVHVLKTEPAGEPSGKRAPRKRKEGSLTYRTPVQETIELVPPEDGYTWKKYGRKAIVDSRFLRSYYRCAKTSDCNAKKQVQQDDGDLLMLNITYEGQHTCQTFTMPFVTAAVAAAGENRDPGAGGDSSPVFPLPPLAGTLSASQPQTHNWLGDEGQGTAVRPGGGGDWNEDDFWANFAHAYLISPQDKCMDMDAIFPPRPGD